MDFVQTNIDGLLAGSAYALLALGFSLVFGIMRQINLAYGSSLLVGAALAVWLEPILGLGVVAWPLLLGLVWDPLVTNGIHIKHSVVILGGRFSW